MPKLSAKSQADRTWRKFAQLHGVDVQIDRGDRAEVHFFAMNFSETCQPIVVRYRHPIITKGIVRDSRADKLRRGRIENRISGVQDTLEPRLGDRV